MAGRGVYRGIYSALPDDPDFQRLSPEARLTLLIARVCSQAGPAAIFRFYPELLRAQTGLSARRLEAALVELEAERWIFREGVVMWIRNGLRHDPMTTMANPNHKKSVLKWLAGLPKVSVVLKFCDYYQMPYPFRTHPDPMPMGSESKDTDTDTDSDTDTDTDTEKRKECDAGASEPPPPARITFKIPTPVVEALDRCPKLGAVARLRLPEWWQAELRANPGVDLAVEVLKAEAYLVTHPERHYKRLDKLLHGWLGRADREA